MTTTSIGHGGGDGRGPPSAHADIPHAPPRRPDAASLPSASSPSLSADLGGPITSLPVKVTMLLCDAAQVSDGKLYILGGGWSMTGPDPVPSAVALKIDVDWHEAETSHHWELFLEDADGRPVLMETAEGTQPVEVRGRVHREPAPGDPRGLAHRRGPRRQPRAHPAGARAPASPGG